MVWNTAQSSVKKKTEVQTATSHEMFCTKTYVNKKWINNINPSSTGKIEKFDFEMPIIPQSLNMNNLRSTNIKLINVHTIRKFIKYFLKNFP